ncbi:MAG: hypothetical protein ACYCOR_02555 [Acidobacteriaceae bacterium]
MRPKATLPLLLLLLMTVQAFAAVCDARCAAMSISMSRNSMPGMANCHGMVSVAVAGRQAVAALTSSQLCASQICKSDWTFLRSPVVHELDISTLPATVSGSVAIPVQIACPLQCNTGRSTHSITAHDPLISKLRI